MLLSSENCDLPDDGWHRQFRTPGDTGSDFATISLSSSTRMFVIMRGAMRVALLVVTVTLASLLGSLDAWVEFNCFDTPGEGFRCACIGANDCTEMKNSDNCKSEAECDKGELGAIVCSCKAARTSKASGRPPMLFR